MSTIVYDGTLPDGHPLHRLTPEQLDALGREFQAVHDDVYADLNDADAQYIRRMIRIQRSLAAGSRAVLVASRFWPAWVLGTAGLGVAKILENMEIGHNVMHGQWDWMNDPYIHSSTWDWDTASPASAWKHSHNYLHHTYTNIVGKDKDVGYEILRVDDKQPWEPRFLAQPIYNALLALLFEWGVAVHDLDIEAVSEGTKDPEELRQQGREIVQKVLGQVLKDYFAWPAISGVIMTLVEVGVIGLFDPASQEVLPGESRPRRRVLGRRGRGLRSGNVVARLGRRRSFREPFRSTMTANIVANLIRNVWAYAIIFCGHFPEQAWTFTEEEVADETQGGWYLRQLIGSVNIEGGPLFHIMSGNLSFQVEHHLYPDMPSSRYQQIAPRVRAICERYELPYNTGPFLKQVWSVQKKILRLAFPGRVDWPKPGPWREPAVAEEPDAALPAFP
ncbi:MAG: acyl-CoA desaturase [Solirubrobacterales bacterium]|nr:acyl-CoA desaturase [Solirubrobacterales bacterium]